MYTFYAKPDAVCTYVHNPIFITTPEALLRLLHLSVYHIKSIGLYIMGYHGTHRLWTAFLRSQTWARERDRRFEQLFFTTSFCSFPFYLDDTVLTAHTSTVEIGETWVGKKAKYHRGSNHQHAMVFGIVESSGRRCALYLVNRRNSATLIPKLKKHVS